MGRQILPVSLRQRDASDISVSPSANVDACVQCRIAAERGYVVASFLCGHQARANFVAYREAYQKAHGKPASTDRLAYLGLAVVAESRAEAEQRAHKLWTYYKTSPRSPAGTFNPPGYSPIVANAQAYLAGGGKPFAGVMPDGSPLPSNPSLEMLAEAGMMFWGTPDMVVDQITRFTQTVGGLGHFLCMGQGGYLTHRETVNSMKLMADEVYPRIRDLN